MAAGSRWPRPAIAGRGRGAGASGIEPSHRQTRHPQQRQKGRRVRRVRRGRERAEQRSEGRRIGRPHHIDVGGGWTGVLDPNTGHDRIERQLRRRRLSVHHSFGQGMFDPRALHTPAPYRPARTQPPRRAPRRDDKVRFFSARLTAQRECITRRLPDQPLHSAHAPAHRAQHDCSPDPHSLRSPANTRTGQALTVDAVRRVSFSRHPEAKRTQ